MSEPMSARELAEKLAEIAYFSDDGHGATSEKLIAERMLPLLTQSRADDAATIKELREAHDKIHELTQELCYSSGDDRADMQKFIVNIGTIGQISRVALAKGKE